MLCVIIRCHYVLGGAGPLNLMGPNRRVHSANKFPLGLLRKGRGGGVVE